MTPPATMKMTASQRHLKTLKRFVEVYCHKKHHAARGELCGECGDLLAYAEDRLARCRLDPKPKCKDCKIHCYQDDYRRRIQEVMKFSGIYFVKRGRIDGLIRYFM